MSVVRATRSEMVRVGDRVHRIRRRLTTAHADSQIVAEYPDLWEPMPIDFPAEAGVTINVHGSIHSEAELLSSVRDGLARGGTVAVPSSKAVRAWAKAQGLDVPSRGPIPDEVVEQYKAAQEEG